MVTLSQKDGQSITLKIDPRLYNERVIYKCFYWYGDDYEVSITIDGDEFFEVMLTKRTGELSDVLQEALLKKAKRDLVDFKTRDIITQETKTIRELLIAKAFANHDAFDAEPVGMISDPVGFAPSDFEESPGRHVEEV